MVNDLERDDIGAVIDADAEVIAEIAERVRSILIERPDANFGRFSLEETIDGVYSALNAQHLSPISEYDLRKIIETVALEVYRESQALEEYRRTLENGGIFVFRGDLGTGERARKEFKSVRLKRRFWNAFDDKPITLGQCLETTTRVFNAIEEITQQPVMPLKKFSEGTYIELRRGIYHLDSQSYENKRVLVQGFGELIGAYQTTKYVACIFYRHPLFRGKVENRRDTNRVRDIDRVTHMEISFFPNPKMYTMQDLEKIQEVRKRLRRIKI